MSREMPWFPFYPVDFVNSRRVRTMSPEEVGVYALLLFHSWEEPLPDDDVALAGLANGADANTVRTVLEQCFNRTPEGWVNERLEEVRGEQEDKRMKKVRAGRASGKSRRRKKIDRHTEHRSNGVRTPLQHTSNKLDTDTESDTDTEEKKGTSIGASIDAPTKTDDPWPARPKKDASGQYEYPEPFEQAWAEYPERNGSNPKVGAYKSFRARVKAGDDPTDLTTAAIHYRQALVLQTKEGTEFVQQASTFWGPSEPWREYLAPPSTRGSTGLSEADRRLVQRRLQMEPVDLNESFR